MCNNKEKEDRSATARRCVHYALFYPSHIYGSTVEVTVIPSESEKTKINQCPFMPLRIHPCSQ